MTKIMIYHFVLAIWNDLILNRNKLGRRRNMFLIRQDAMCIYRRATNGNHFHN